MASPGSPTSPSKAAAAAAKKDAKKNTLTLTDNRNGKSIELAIHDGTQGPSVVDISNLYAQTGLFSYDPGFSGTAACRSAITYIDGDKGILQYRGYDIAWLLEHCDHMDICYLLLHGELPLRGQRQEFVRQIKRRSFVDENIRRLLQGFRHDAHPMAILVGAVGALSALYDSKAETPAQRDVISLRIIAKLPTIAAWGYRYSRGEPFIYPREDLSYAANFLHMLFAKPNVPHRVDPVLAKALDIILIIHADHEQNASTTTVRNAGSSQANPFACIASGIASLWGPAHGGANEAVIRMLEKIGSKEKIPEFVARAKDPKDTFRLMGFGHRVYKNYDPRAKIMQKLCHQVLSQTGIDDPLLSLAMELEQVALKDEYFIRKKLYPNVDFYSGIVFRALGFPTAMFTVLFAVGRVPGWIAHWKEMMDDPNRRIVRPRQLYVGKTARHELAKL